MKSATTREQIQINPQTLVVLGLLTPERLEAVTAEAKRLERSVSGVLLNQGFDLEHLYRAYAHENAYPYVSIDDIDPPGDVRQMVRHDVARSLQVVPLSVSHDGRVLIAVSNPSRRVRNALEEALPYEIDYAIASILTLQKKVAEYYSAASEAATIAIASATTITDNTPSLDELLSASSNNDQAVSKNVGLLIMEGLQRGASDIHLEPIAKMMRVRYRVDGELRTAKEITYQPNDGDRIIANIKAMCGLDATERRLPQDGRVSFKVRDRKIDLRIAIIPVSSGLGGEKVVLRILSSEMAGEPLDKLDFSDMNLRMLRSALRKPNGLILVTGPTGSGKSTTLYSGINEVAVEGVNVMTAEDPVEYKFDGINQVQINTDIDLTFARVLRTFLRADPDVILVGEIRDEETVEIATKAALTGHLVLSTLHTNSAALTVTRLIEMGLEPYVVADALTTCLSQRLVKRLCTRCRVPYVPSLTEVERLSGEIPDSLPTVFAANPEGCRNCRRGYLGRVPLHELMPITSDIKAAIASGAKAPEIEQMAIASGRMKTLVQDGWGKILLGKTDIAQVASIMTTDDDFGQHEPEHKPHGAPATLSTPPAPPA